MEHDATRTRVEQWISEFSEALAAQDVDRAASLFGDDSYWRDLIALTWNLKTSEGREEIAAMLRATLETAAPGEFAVLGEPTEADGVTEAWFSFETAVGRGTGHLRLVDGEAWTFLTTLDELKGNEEPKNHRRPRGAEHGANPDRVTWQEERDAELAELGRTR